jgi:zinc protease
MKKLFFASLTCVACLVATAQDATVDPTRPLPLDPNVRTGKLANGITYFIRYNAKPEHRAELRLAVNAGSTMENDNQLGLAHFTEHMCFNGSFHFKKNELVDYLESVGTKFGPHLNAYTSFDETVYMMQIPTDKPDIVTKGFQIMEDWSHLVSFDTTEVNKERGVVTEEWRLGLGANERMLQKYFPVLFKNSRYAVRLPIGKKDIIQNCSYQTLKDFYNDWYRPELMAVIAVGDFNVDSIEALIRLQFSGVPQKQNARPVTAWEVPDQKEPAAIVVSDKENTNTAVELVYKQKTPFRPAVVGDYQQLLAIALFNGMINKRLEELSRRPDPPFVFAYSFKGDFVRTKDAYVNYAQVPESGIEKGLKALVTENERIRRFGFTQSELDRTKTEMLRYYEQAYAEREKSESGNYAGEYVSLFLKKEPSPGIANEYAYAKKFIPQIRLEDVNALAKVWITSGENMVLIAMQPEKDGLKPPTEQSLLDVIKQAQAAPITAYDDKVSTKPLISAAPKAGTIVKTAGVPQMGITEWKLSNGARVVFKQTDFKNDEILFSAQSKGGTSLVADNEYASATHASSIIDESGIADFDATALQKMLSGKIVQVSPYMNALSEGFRGRCSPRDLETMMQLVHLYFTKPRKDTDAFKAYIQNTRASIENRQLAPITPFRDTISCTMSCYHFRSRPFTTQVLNEISLSKAYDVYRNRFADAGDFTFYFVGNIDRDLFKVLVETYIASLPGLNSKETWKDPGINPPAGRTDKLVKKGVEPKSNVYMQFYGDAKYSRNNRYMMMALTRLMSIKLRETMREDKGGVYGVNASGNLTHYPGEKYTVSVSFGCAPENVDMLVSTAVDELDKIRQNGCDEKDLTKLKETIRREREVNLKENAFWLYAMAQFDLDQENIAELNDLDTFVKNLDSYTLKEAARQYLGRENYAKFVLMPEK